MQQKPTILSLRRCFYLMAKKKLNITDITNELQRSAFFPQPTTDHAQDIRKESQAPVEPETFTETKAMVQRDTMIPRHHDTTVSRYHDTTTTSTNDGILEEVRKIVKQVGKEPATQRLTMQEKQEIADIEYAYKRQGIKTSGNEIIRIATNYIVKDFKNNGEESILAKVLKRLNS